MGESVLLYIIINTSEFWWLCESKRTILYLCIYIYIIHHSVFSNYFKNKMFKFWKWNGYNEWTITLILEEIVWKDLSDNYWYLWVSLENITKTMTKIVMYIYCCNYKIWWWRYIVAWLRYIYIVCLMYCVLCIVFFVWYLANCI